jgi:hypothetical protein
MVLELRSTTVDLGEGWENAEPTEIDGIVRIHRKGDLWPWGEPMETDTYVVSFTATIDADSAEQASERAMHLREWLVNRDWIREKVPDFAPTFDWHLHDHDGC